MVDNFDCRGWVGGFRFRMKYNHSKKSVYSELICEKLDSAMACFRVKCSSVDMFLNSHMGTDMNILRAILCYI